MDSKAMDPLGKALVAFFEGDGTAELIIRREDGQEIFLPAGHFFRHPSEFSLIEKTALERCRGHVLDVGAGTGLHSLVLQEMKLRVTAIDMSWDAVDIMARRGVKDVHCADIFEFSGGRFDTLLMMGHGIGLVETLAGLDRFLSHARNLVSQKGLILLDSLDVRATGEPANRVYQETIQKAGRYFGEIKMQCRHGSHMSAVFGWLQVDADTLKEHAGKTGWRCDIPVQEEDGNYLAMLTIVP